MVGHSGDSPEIPFVDYNAPPQTRKQRLEVLERMVAHTQVRAQRGSRSAPWCSPVAGGGGALRSTA